MPDPITTDTPIKKTPKTIRQIVTEVHENKEPAPKKEEPKVEKIEEDVVKKKEERVKARKEEEDKKTEEVVKKVSEETASKVAEETKQAFKEEIQKILDKPLDDQAKQKEADELIATFEKEKRLPKDYPELISETQRIAEVKAKRTMEEILAKRDADAKVQREKVDADRKVKEESDKKDLEQRTAQINKAVQDDLDKLYDIKELTKPADLKEIDNEKTEDPDAQNVQKFMNFAITKVKEHRDKGETIPTLWKIYHEEYKPTITKDNQPAGADAPIAGATGVPPQPIQIK